MTDRVLYDPKPMEVFISARWHRQRQILEWCKASFGEKSLALPQRGIHMLEEAIELAQAVGVDPAMAHKLIDFVYDRPKGSVAEELGGIGVCVAALAEAAGLDADECEVLEFERVLSKPTSHFAARNEAKNAAGFDTSLVESKP